MYPLVNKVDICLIFSVFRSVISSEYLFKAHNLPLEFILEILQLIVFYCFHSCVVQVCSCVTSWAGVYVCVFMFHNLTSHCGAF